jgi:hypothetical protein
MKRILSAAVAAVIAVGVGVAAPTTASAAVPSSVVTTTEFLKVAYGNSIDYVRKTFGNNGTVTYKSDKAGTAYDRVTVEFPTYEDSGFVSVDFRRKTNNTWYLYTKSAYWGVDAPWTATNNKATQAEFAKIAVGNSIDHVRKTFGSTGTIWSYFDAPGTSYDSVTIEWPTTSEYGWVWVDFVKTSSGAWKVDTRSAYWGIDAPWSATNNKATQAEYNKLKPGNSIDYARQTFGTSGTITSYFDAPGYSNDSVTLEWPTTSEYGYVTVDFIKNSSGAWKIETLDAYWG